MAEKKNLNIVDGHEATKAFMPLPLAAAEPTAEDYIPLWQWKQKGENKRSRPSDGIIDAGWAELLPTWMSWCVNHHDECGQRELDSIFGDTEDILLIDTGRLCLLKAQTNYRYIALSYVWGPNPHFTTITTTRSIEGLLKQESLLHIWDRLPRVVQEAIDLTDRIGERFLWLDFLCIVQDDARHLSRQLKLMAEIYNSASATFIACAGNHADVRLVPPALSWSAISTLQPRTRKYRLDIYRPKPPEAKDLLATISASTHSTRGWTYQEKLLSRRCLYFLHDRIVYRCRADMYIHDGGDYVYREIAPPRWWRGMTVMEKAEDVLLEGVRRSEEGAARSRRRRFLSDWPRNMSQTDWFRGFKFWADIIQEYSQKQFSFESDVLDACSGVLTAFQRYSGWHISQGSPELLFDYVLLWVPRGEAEARNFAATENPFPTWSWLGWRGGAVFALAWREKGLNEYRNRLRYLSTFGQKIDGLLKSQPIESSSGSRWHFDGPTENVIFNDYASGQHFTGRSLRFVAECVPASTFLNNQNDELPPGDISWTFSRSIWLSTCYSSKVCGVLYGISRKSFDLLKIESADGKLSFILLSDIRLTQFKSVNWKLAFESIDRDLRMQKESNSRLKHDGPENAVIYDNSSRMTEHYNDSDKAVRLGPFQTSIPIGTIRNVMLIRRLGECFERVAIAQLSGSAWREAQPSELDVCLN